MSCSNHTNAMGICPQRATENFQAQASPSRQKASITRFMVMCAHRAGSGKGSLEEGLGQTQYIPAGPFLLVQDCFGISKYQNIGCWDPWVFSLYFGCGLLVGQRMYSQECQLEESMWADFGSVLAYTYFLLPILLKKNFISFWLIYKYGNVETLI